MLCMAAGQRQVLAAGDFDSDNVPGAQGRERLAPVSDAAIGGSSPITTIGGLVNTNIVPSCTFLVRNPYTSGICKLAAAETGWWRAFGLAGCWFRAGTLPSAVMHEVQLDRVLESLITRDATEVRLVAGLPPRLFRGAVPLPVTGPDLQAADVDRLMRGITPETAQAALVEHGRVAYGVRFGEHGHFVVELEMIDEVLAMVIHRARPKQ